MAASYDVYFLLHPFPAVVDAFTRAVRPMLPDLERQHLLGVEGYLCDETQAVLLNLRFHRDFASLLGPGRLADMLARWGSPLIAPEELSPEERERFFLEHLANYTTYVQLYPSPRERMPLLERVLERLSEHLPRNAPPPAPSAVSERAPTLVR